MPSLHVMLCLLFDFEEESGETFGLLWGLWHFHHCFEIRILLYAGLFIKLPRIKFIALIFDWYIYYYYKKLSWSHCYITDSVKNSVVVTFLDNFATALNKYQGLFCYLLSEHSDALISAAFREGQLIYQSNNLVWWHIHSNF